MSAPVEQFSNLSLHTPMSSPIVEISRRKIEVRDILSSFQRGTLPSEYRQDVYSRIDLAQSRRPSSEWSIPGDLEGTLMQWGVHNDDCWNFLRQCQSQETRALLFNQKISRRLNEEFEKYHALPLLEHAGHFEELSTPEIREAVQAISERIRALVDAAHVDRQERRIGDGGGRVRPLVDTLRKVCECYEDMSHVRRSGRRSTSGGEPETSLYLTLIHRAEPGQDQFMLDLLETVSVEVLTGFGQELEAISRQLEAHRAPEAYRQRFQGLLGRIPGQQTTTATVPEPEAEREDTSEPVDRRPPTGSKRPAAESSARRGRRKTGK